MTTLRRAATVAVLLAAVSLAACGSDSPKVSSQGYLDRCGEEVGKRAKEQTQVKISDQQVADICKCTQDKLVAQGFGDRSIDDEKLNEDKGREVGSACTVKVLTGS